MVSAHLLLPQALEDGLPAVDRTFAGFREGGRDQAGDAGATPTALESRVSRLERFLRGVEGGTRWRRLDFLHLALPHFPYQYLPSGQSYPGAPSDPPGLTDEVWSSDSWLTTQAYQRYLLQVGFVDRLIGRLMQRLREGVSTTARSS